MEKVILKLHIPAIGQVFELSAPNTMTGENLIILVLEILYTEYQIRKKNQDCDLFLKRSGKAIHLNRNLKDLNLRDGDELFMM